jgi:hypothetical protein
MNGNIRTPRISVFLYLLFLPLVSLRAQEIRPADITPNTDDTRCVESKYRHKTAGELRRMTPEQLIDETAKEWNYHVSLMDRYGMFTLASYTDKIGVEIIPVLNKLAKEFASRPLSACQQERFFTAFAIASDVDEQTVRLRSIKEGRDAITAADEAINKMKEADLGNDATHPYNKSHFGEYLLDSLRGTTQFDDDIRELLVSEFHLELSDQQFAAFINFLTSKHPNYPSWTPRIEMARDLRPNKKRYHDAYLEFKGTGVQQ